MDCSMLALNSSSTPTTIRSGYRKSTTAVPSRRNSGLDATQKESCGAPLRSKDLRSDWQVRTGTVLFSTMSFLSSMAAAISFATASTNDKSASPDQDCGVPTVMKTASDCFTASGTDVEKVRR